MKELGISQIATEDAGIRLSSAIAQRIISSGEDLMKGLRELESLWVRTHYAKSLAEMGTLYDDVWIARTSGQTDTEIREMVHPTLTRFLESHTEE